MDPNISDDERVKALKCCTNNLGGVWKVVSSSDVSINRVSGGLTNFLYYCALPDTVETYDQEPKKVLIRFYGTSIVDRAKELEVFKKLASEGLGPSLYCSFDGGRIEEYLPSNPLSWNDQNQDDISAAIARKLAVIHKIHVESLNNNDNWLIATFNQFYETVKLFRKKQPKFPNDLSEPTKTIVMQLLAMDLKQEIDYMEQLFQIYSAPLVLSHNDLHQNNILLLHDKSKSLDDRIVIIDYEFCSRNYRAFDLANHLCECCFDYTRDEYPYFSCQKDKLPSGERQRQFLSHYVSEMDTDGELSSRQRIHEIDILFDEMQPLLMASNLLAALWSIDNAFTSKIKFGFWELARCKLELYSICKQNFEQKTTKCRSDYTC